MSTIVSENRIESLDILKGVVMVLMAIDHSRTFLHVEYLEFNAEDLSMTYPALFFTRWITHFCAPVFIFLSGTSIFIIQAKRKNKMQVSKFLLKRGLFLVILEFTLFRFCWNPDMLDQTIWLLVIWAIGMSMIFMAALIHLPYKIILVFGLVVLFMHNLLEFIDSDNLFWRILYKGGKYEFQSGLVVYPLYSLIPYFGLIALGYCLGKIYGRNFDQKKRRTILVTIGLTSILLFVLLRYFNFYGDPSPWIQKHNFMYSLMSFLKTTKYPVSLQYNLMTLGPCILALAYFERARSATAQFFSIIGTVPMFYYTLHLPAFLTIATLFGWNTFSLLAVWLWFAIVVTILFFLSKKYARYKFSHPSRRRWLSFF